MLLVKNAGMRFVGDARCLPVGTHPWGREYHRFATAKLTPQPHHTRPPPLPPTTAGCWFLFDDTRIKSFRRDGIEYKTRKDVKYVS